LIPRGLYLADTSAAARAGHEAVLNELTRIGRLGLAATCATVDLEVRYSARSPAEYVEIAESRTRGLTDLALNEAISLRARAVQAALATRSQHRSAGIVDLLTAATAEHYGAIVLHYDADFDAIAEVTGQAVRWVVPAGSVP